MRFFIALELLPENTLEIEQVQASLKEIFPYIRLTDPNKLHLTLAFVGDQDSNLKEPLVELIQNAAEDIPTFNVTPAYIDGFPNLHQAHILWMGVNGEIDKLMILREKVKDGIIKLGLEADERRYIPHITIGKVDDFYLTENNEKKLGDIINHQFRPIQIESLKLFESIPQEGFHQHSTLAEVRLNPPV